MRRDIGSHSTVSRCLVSDYHLVYSGPNSVQFLAKESDMAPNSQAPNIFEDAPRMPTKPSVIRSILSAKAHKRNLSADEVIAPKPFHRAKPSDGSAELPVDGQNQNQQPLTEIAANRDAGDGAKSPTKSEKGPLHKKTRSAVSLKSLKSYMERKDKSEDLPDEDSLWKPKKVKSANSLTAILKRSQRGRKGDDSSKDGINKENRSPVDFPDSLPSPVWTPYGAGSLQEQPGSPWQRDRRRTLHDEVSLYTPKGYGPTQQRNFYDFRQPSLAKRSDPKPRPKSDILSGNNKVKEMLSAVRSPSDNARPAQPSEPPSPSKPQGRSRRFSRPRTRSNVEQEPEEKPEPSPQKSSRVQAAISAFNAKEQQAEMSRQLNPKELESEFEKLLVSRSQESTFVGPLGIKLTVIQDARNIPHNMRDKMRSLDTNIKVDFIQKDRSESATPHSANAATGTTDSTRRGRNKEQKEEHTRESKSRSRSRSRGFSFSKGSVSPTKKRSESGSSHKRPKSADFSQPATLANILTPSTSVTSLSMTNNHDTAADPSDFVHYLREIQKPEMVEVGKVHKLRLLLRNETVTWVDTFIADGGMNEIVQLLYRIMKVEWRYVFV